MKPLWLAVLLLLAGCHALAPPPLATVPAQSPADAPGPAPRDAAPEEQSPVAPSASPVQPTEMLEAVDDLTAVPEDTQPLTLEAAIRLALEHNPDLVALRQDVPVSRAALRAAQIYPHNPSVTVEVDPVDQEYGDGSLATRNTVTIAQTVELAHQRRYRTRAAAADLTRTVRNVLGAEVQTAAEAQRRFCTAIYLRQVYEYDRAMADLDDRLLEVLKRRFEAGQSTAADVALARVEARSIQQQARLAEVAYHDAINTLRTYLGFQGDEKLELQGQLSEWRWMPADAALASVQQTPSDQDPEQNSAEDVSDGCVDLESLVARRPDVRAAAAELHAAQAQCCLARASRIPNVTVGPTYERDESKTLFFGLQMQMDVPVIDTGQAAVCQRETEAHQKQVALEQLRLKARSEIQAALERYQRARATVEEFRHDRDEGLDREVQKVADLFAAGETDVLTLYTARTNVLQAEKYYLDAFNELAQATADLSAATATPFDVLVEPRSEAPQP